MSVEFEVVADPARACSALLVGAAAAGGQIVLAGGSTPRAAYLQFVDAVRDVGLDVGGATFWFGDERCVPPDDERSNYLMVKRSLLDQLGPSSQPQVRRIRGELGPVSGADDYEQALRDAGEPQFDLVLLGIGADGHTASLFPDQPSLSERSRMVVGVAQAGLEPFVPRVTLTLPALAQGEHVVFLATGQSKADPIARAFGADARPDPHVPSSMLAALAERTTVLLDPPAAAKL